MTAMDAIVLEEPGTDGLRVRSVEVPEPAPRNVLVRVRACGLGRTVLNKVRQLKPEQLPRIPGHEAAGDIVAIGDAVQGIEPGTPVILYYYVTCGACRHCWEGREPLCEHGRFGSTVRASEPFDSALRIGEDVDGALAEFVTVPARNVIPMPDDLDYVPATTAPDAIATPLHICQRANVAPGERLVVVGAAGGVGIHLLQIARLFGADPIAVDLPSKLDGLVRYGAVATVDGSNPEWHRELGGAADVVVDLVGTAETLRNSLGGLGPRGRLALLTTDRDVELSVVPLGMVAGERAIVGSKYASHAEVQRAVDLLAEGKVEAVVSQTVTLAEAPDVLRAIEHHEFFARGAISID